MRSLLLQDLYRSWRVINSGGTEFQSLSWMYLQRLTGHYAERVRQILADHLLQLEHRRRSCSMPDVITQSAGLRLMNAAGLAMAGDREICPLRNSALMTG